MTTPPASAAKALSSMRGYHFVYRDHGRCSKFDRHPEALMITTPSLPPAVPPRPDAATRDATLRQRAQELESVFLAEMLRHAGSARPPESFGGGVGEDQFASFLRQAQADAIVRKGGIGLAEALFESLKARADANR
jgi:peptidoglycan hydrolase FlgJ